MKLTVQDIEDDWNSYYNIDTTIDLPDLSLFLYFRNRENDIKSQLQELLNWLYAHDVEDVCYDEFECTYQEVDRQCNAAAKWLKKRSEF